MVVCDGSVNIVLQTHSGKVGQTSRAKCRDRALEKQSTQKRAIRDIKKKKKYIIFLKEA